MNTLSLLDAAFLAGQSGGTSGLDPTATMRNLWRFAETSGSRIDAINGEALAAPIYPFTLPTRTAGKVGYGLDFASYGTTGMQCAGLHLPTEFSVAMWLNLPAVRPAAFMWPFTLTDNTGSQSECSLNLSSGLYPIFRLFDNAASSDYAQAGSPITAATWFWVCFWRKLGTIGIQVDGTTVEHSTAIGPTGVTASPLRLGFSTDPGSYSDVYWDGLINQLVIWPYAMTASQRAVIYNGGSGVSL